MATIKECAGTKGTKYQSIVRRGSHHLSRVFFRKGDAEKWGFKVELAIENGTKAKPFIKEDYLQEKARAKSNVSVTLPNEGWSVADALEFYGRTISVEKKGWAQELRRIKQWRGRLISKKALGELTTADLQGHVDARKRQVTSKGTRLSGNTIRSEIMLLRAMYRDAKNEWKLDLLNPCVDVILPKPNPHRERRLKDGRGNQAGEYDRLYASLADYNRGDELCDLFDLAIGTALRRSELLYLRVRHCETIDGVAVVRLPDSKSGKPREVYLSPKAEEIINRRISGKQESDRLFSVSHTALTRFWLMARRKAEVVGLRWHDLRHEGLSRMASAGLHLRELQAQAGHSTPAMTMKYVTIKPKDVADKLRAYG